MKQPIIIPELHALLTIVTDLTLEELARRTGTALGVVFQEDKSGDFEELGAFTAPVFTHIIGLYREWEDEASRETNSSYDSRRQESGQSARYSLDMRPYISTIAVGIDYEKSDFVDLEVSEFLAAFLCYDTGLPWEAVQILDPSEST